MQTRSFPPSTYKCLAYTKSTQLNLLGCQVCVFCFCFLLLFCCCCFIVVFVVVLLLFFQHKVLGMILNWVITTVHTDSKTFAFVSASTRQQIVCTVTSTLSTFLSYLSASLCAYQNPHILRSSNEKLLKITKHNLISFGVRLFSFVVPSLWDSLTANPRNIPTLSGFKTQLKTFLFRQAFSRTQADHSCDNRLCVCLCIYMRVNGVCQCLGFLLCQKISAP